MTTSEEIKTVHFNCPLCAQSIEAPETQLGKATICPTCERGFIAKPNIENLSPKTQDYIKAIRIPPIHSDSANDRLNDTELFVKWVAALVAVVCISAWGYNLILDREEKFSTSWCGTGLIIALLLYISGLLLEIRDRLGK